MSAHRELMIAQQELHDATEAWVATFAAGRYLPPGGTTEDLVEAWKRYDELRRDLDAAGPANHRHTSIAASRADLPVKGSTRRKIIQVVTAHWDCYGVGMTDAELEGRLRKSHQTVSAARNELVKRGWLRDTGATKLTQYKREAVAWGPTDLARSAMRETAIDWSDA